MKETPFELIAKYKLAKTKLVESEILFKVARRAITSPLSNIIEIMCLEERKVFKNFIQLNPNHRIPVHIKPLLYPETIDMDNLQLKKIISW